MLSAPATIPATSDDTFDPAFAPLSDGTLKHRSTSSRSPAESASDITGTSPIDATRFASSNPTDVAPDM
jgi:hypothetical protein